MPGLNSKKAEYLQISFRFPALFCKKNRSLLGRAYNLMHLMELHIQSNEAVFEAIVEGVFTRGYAVADGFLPSLETRQIQQAVSSQYQHGHFNAAGIGKGQHYRMNQDIRRDHIHWIDHNSPPDAFVPFFNQLQGLVQYFNRTCYLGIRDMEFHLAVYPQGAFYKRHLDVFRHTHARKLSVIFYLNIDWEESQGGQLRLYLPREDGGEETLDLDPIAGRLVCFNSHTIEHEVLAARRERHSITGWLKDEPALF